MSWYRAESGDSDDPRLLKLARALGLKGSVGLFAAHGLVCRVRERVAAQFEDGVLDGLEPDDVDAWTLDGCGRALVDLGFLVWTTESDAPAPRLALEDWAERAGNSKWAEQKRNQRAKLRERKQMSADIAKTLSGQSADSPPIVSGTHTNERTNERTTAEQLHLTNDDPVPSKLSLVDVVGIWNEHGTKLPKARKGGPERERHFRARLNADTERLEASWWIALVKRIDASPFLRGESEPRDGRRPFRVDIDWVLKEDNLAKILEGKFDPIVPVRRDTNISAEEWLRRQRERGVEA